MTIREGHDKRQCVEFNGDKFKIACECKHIFIA